MKKAVLIIAQVSVLLTGSVSCTQEGAQKSKDAIEYGLFEPDWESLSKHYQTPEWFRDAKFGIYTHWGPVTVGAEDATKGRVQWYGRGMYMPDDPAFEYHRNKFGDQHEFGYKDVIPLFKAKKFDAEEWADLFAASGAKFAGPVVVHHDNFAMWNSDLTEWDSVDKGPQRDITGELEKAIRQRDMKFIATFHHGFSWRYYEPAYKFDAADGKYVGLYCEPHSEEDPPTKEYLDKWLGMVNEVVNNYEPDLIWFDFGLGSEKYNCITPEYQQRMFADYYNWAGRQNRQVGVTHKHWHIHEHAGIIDFERGRMDKLTEFAWLTDTSIGPWFHQKSVPYKSTDQIIDVLVDIVSKNGCMLLNVGPASDGTIPPAAKELLLSIGDWLKVNGEAIYATRPWEVYGEGPSKMEKSGGFSEKKPVSYTAQDIRFTRSKDGKTVYAIILDMPSEPVTIHSLYIRSAHNPKVELLGYKGRIDFSVSKNRRLTIQVPYIDPEHSPCQHAYAFKLTGFDITSPSKELKFAFVTCAVDAKFFVPVKKGLKDASEMLGVQCDFLGTKGVDVKAQAEMIRQAVKDGYDGIAVNIIDPEAFDEVIQEAIDKGVPVIGFNVDDHATPNARLSSVNQRLYDAGKSLGEYALPFISKNAHVLMTMHDEGVSALEDRLRGIQEVLKKKNVKWTVIIPGNDSVKGADVIADALKKHRDIKVIFGTGQSDTEAAGRAIEKYFVGKEYWSVGFDLSAKTLQLIQDGHIRCTVDQQPYTQGFYPVVQLTHYLRYGIKPSNIDAGAAIIDKSNVQQVVELTEQDYR